MNNQYDACKCAVLKISRLVVINQPFQSSKVSLFPSAKITTMPLSMIMIGGIARYALYKITALQATAARVERPNDPWKPTENPGKETSFSRL